VLCDIPLPEGEVALLSELIMPWELSQSTGEVAAAPIPAYHVISTCSIGEMRSHLAQWDVLAQHAVEPNIFYEHWMLLPALEAYGEGRVELALVQETDSIRRRTRLVGVFPLEFDSHFRGLRLRAASLWRHPHCYLGTPLIHGQAGHRCWDAILKWLRERGCSVLEIGRMHIGGEFIESLVEHSRQRRRCFHIGSLYTRPMIEVTRLDGPTYIREQIASSHRQTYQRKRRRLAEKGNLQVERLSPDGDVDQWIDLFLALEASGWKGKAGTALACTPADREFFRAITRSAFARGRLLALVLRLDAQPLAALNIIKGGEGAFSLKTAFDESWGHYSPGSLLEMDTINAVCAEPGLRWVDSCSAADTSLKDLWKQRRLMGEIVCPVDTLGSIVTSSIPLAQCVKRRLRNWRHRNAARDD
jgi:CelD/BcsL family acetyltransferase involved in cellulose biosynthesis